MLFRQLFDNTSSTYTYLLADETTRRAILIDPVFEQAQRDMALLRELDLSLALVVDTHAHADHLHGLDDVRMDVEVTPNRGDWLSHVGIAREVAPGGVAGVALTPIPRASPLDLEVKSGEHEVSHGGVTIRIDEPELCYRFLGVIIRGVKVEPSPQWMAARLRAVGQQPINNVVDATNYVMLEMGNPMHAYDLGKLEGSSLIVRKATEGETYIETVWGRGYVLRDPNEEAEAA